MNNAIAAAATAGGGVGVGGVLRVLQLAMMPVHSVQQCSRTGRSTTEGERLVWWMCCWRSDLRQRQVGEVGAIALDAGVGQVHGRVQIDCHRCVVVDIDLRYNSVNLHMRCG